MRVICANPERLTRRRVARVLRSTAGAQVQIREVLLIGYLALVWLACAKYSTMALASNWFPYAFEMAINRVKRTLGFGRAL